LILNEAVGGPWPNPTNASTQSGGTAHFEVDYIRVWRTVNTTVTDLTGTPPVTGTGKWEVDANGKFISPEGNRTRFIGANLSYHGFIGPLNNRISGSSAYPNGADIAQWGWNMIRLVGAASWGDPVTLANQTIAIHNDLAPRKIVLMVADFSAGVGTNPAGGQPAQTDQYFARVIDAIGDSPYCWINYQNEPYWDAGQGWINYHNHGYNFIRSRPKGANTMFVVDCWNSGQGGAANIGDFNTFRAGKHHVVMSYHAYMAGKTASSLEGERTTLNTAKIPWLIGEYAFSASRPGFSCCGGTYDNQRAGALKIINEWFPAGESSLWWMGNCDYDPNPTSGYVFAPRTATPGTGTGYNDWNAQLNEAGQAMWNQRALSKTW
jgi:hypothetical protein